MKLLTYTKYSFTMTIKGLILTCVLLLVKYQKVTTKVNAGITVDKSFTTSKGNSRLEFISCNLREEPSLTFTHSVILTSTNETFHFIEHSKICGMQLKDYENRENLLPPTQVSMREVLSAFIIQKHLYLVVIENKEAISVLRYLNTAKSNQEMSLSSNYKAKILGNLGKFMKALLFNFIGQQFIVIFHNNKKGCGMVSSISLTQLNDQCTNRTPDTQAKINCKVNLVTSLEVAGSIESISIIHNFLHLYTDHDRVLKFLIVFKEQEQVEFRPAAVDEAAGVINEDNWLVPVSVRKIFMLSEYMDRKPTLSDFGEKSTNTKSTLSFIGIGLENQILDLTIRTEELLTTEQLLTYLPPSHLLTTRSTSDWEQAHLESDMSTLNKRQNKVKNSLPTLDIRSVSQPHLAPSVTISTEIMIVISEDEIIQKDKNYTCVIIINNNHNETDTNSDEDSDLLTCFILGKQTQTENMVVVNIVTSLTADNESTKLEEILINATTIGFNCSQPSCTNCIENYSAHNQPQLKCGWCEQRCVSVEECDGNSSSALEAIQCSDLSISSYYPISGPTTGGTTVWINVTEPVQKDGIIISIGDNDCEILRAVGYSVQCITSPSPIQGDLDISMRKDSKDVWVLTGYSFYYGFPNMAKVVPTSGSQAGGTLLNIYGKDLDIGNSESTVVYVGDGVCLIELISKSLIRCITPSSESTGKVSIKLMRNENNFTNPHLLFHYNPSPQITSVNPKTIIKSGGVVLHVFGNHFNPTNKKVVMDIICGNNAMKMNCTILNTTALSCTSPPLPSVDCSRITYNNEVSVTLSEIDLIISPDPHIEDKSCRVENSKIQISLMGSHLNSVSTKQISVEIDGNKCHIFSQTSVQLSCKAQIPSGNQQISHSTVVVVMADIVMNLGEVQCVSSNGSSSFPYTAIVVVVLTLVTSFTLLIMAVIGAAYWRKKHPPLINSLNGTDVRVGTHILNQPANDYFQVIEIPKGTEDNIYESILDYQNAVKSAATEGRSCVDQVNDTDSHIPVLEARSHHPDEHHQRRENQEIPILPAADDVYIPMHSADYMSNLQTSNSAVESALVSNPPVQKMDQGDYIKISNNA